MKKVTTRPRLEYRNRLFEIRHTHADFGDFAKDFFVIELGPRAGIVALRDDHVLLTHQYRFLIDSYSWELPGGQVDEGETPENAAVRECIEETGYRCSGLEKLVEYYPGLDNFNNRTAVFVSQSVEKQVEFAGDPSEVVEIDWVPLNEALRLVLTGRILDALTIVGLLGYVASRGSNSGLNKPVGGGG